jgi:hypothetical protein
MVRRLKTFAEGSAEACGGAGSLVPVGPALTTAGLAQLLGQHLDGGPGAAVSGGPAVLSQEVGRTDVQASPASGSLAGRPAARPFLGELL